MSTYTKKFLFATDLHLDLTTKKRMKNFCENINSKSIDGGVILTGDLSNSYYLVEHLKYLHDHISNDVKIWFVLGNHDYYSSSVEETNEEVEKLVNKSQYKSRLKWLTSCSGKEQISDNTGIVGCENFWDAFYGKGNKQGILQQIFMVPDYTTIENLKGKIEKREEVLLEISNRVISTLEKKLNQAYEVYDKVVCCVHVPPFKESCYYYNQPLNDNWLYHFCHKRLGDFLLDYMSLRPQKELMVLCGHVHEQTFYKPLSNLIVLVGSANYFKPKISTTLVF